MAHEFTGQRRRRKKRGSGFSQAMTRRGITLYDQHGREWTASVEQKSGMPTGSISPSFSAPWLPDAQYLKVNPDNTSELYIDYQTMYKRRRARLELFHKDAVRAASANKWPTPEKGKYSQEILETLGAPPKPLEPVAAALQENPWILGFSTVVDKRLVNFLQVNRREVTPEEIDGYDFGPASYKKTVERLRAEGTTDASTGEDVEEDETPAEKRAKTPRAERAARRLAQHEAPRAPVVRDVPAPQTTPDADDGTEALAELDEDALLDGLTEDDDDTPDLDATHDPEALGGRRVRPQVTDRVERQTPRRPTQTAASRKHGARRGGGNPRVVAKQAKSTKSTKGKRAGWRGGRKSLADGAKPVVG